MSGYYETRKEDGRWWLIDADDQRFYSLGVDCVTMTDVELDSTALKYEDGPVWFEKWAKGKLAGIRELGFNTLGAWHHMYFWGNGYPKTVELRMTAHAAKANNVWGVGFPDVFDPSFEMSAHKVMIDCFYGKGEALFKDRGLIGYYTDNELHWWGSGGYWGSNQPGGESKETGLVDDYIEKPETSYGKKAWVGFLKDRYKTIECLNGIWQSEYTGFDDLLHLQHYTVDEDVFQQDKTEFLRLIAEKYFSTTSRILKEYDPGRLNLGCRFAGATTPRVVLEVMANYADVISVNFYDHLGKYRDYLKHVHAITGKPVMITEFSFCAGREAGFLTSTNGAQSVLVRDQKKRGEYYKRFVNEAFDLDFLIGTHWFALYDFSGNVHGLIGNYGLYDVRDRLWEEFAEAVREANVSILHRYAPNTVKK